MALEGFAVSVAELLELEPTSRELRRLAEGVARLLREDGTFVIRTAMA